LIKSASDIKTPLFALSAESRFDEGFDAALETVSAGATDAALGLAPVLAKGLAFFVVANVISPETNIWKLHAEG
jgi:hypothetical protein